MRDESIGMENVELNQVYHNFYGKDLDGSQSERVITIPTSAMGRLCKELIETIGVERTKGFLLRYGWNCGVSDAMNMIEIYGIQKESLLVGPTIHTLHGYQEGHKVDLFEVDFDKGILHLEGYWQNSYEAVEHVKLFGISDQPTCHTLTGLASGYLTTIMGEKVIAKEVECQGMGHQHCRVVCRTVKDWDEEIESELKFYELNSLIHELDQTYEQLRHERDNLNMSYEVHEKLMQEVLRDNRLSSQVELLYRITKLPAFIEDSDHHILAAAGVSKDEVYFKELTGLQSINKTEYFQVNHNLGVLRTPIYLNRKIVAYYSFIYQHSKPQEIDNMIIERASLTSSLSLLKDQIRFQSEQRVRGSFLEDILSGTINIDEITKRAYYLGIKLNPYYFMIAVQTTNKTSFLNKLEFNDEVINFLDQYFKSHQLNALMGQKSENIIILLSDQTLLRDQKDKQQLCKKIYNHILMKYPKSQFRFGISTVSNDISVLGQLFEESQVSLKVANNERKIVSYDALGLEGIFFQMNNQENVQKLIQMKMGKLIEEDKIRNGELIKTLYQYLDTGSNVLKTARLMNLSVSGLRYRLERISEILETDIKKPRNTYQLFMVLEFLILSGEVDIDLDMELDID